MRARRDWRLRPGRTLNCSCPTRHVDPFRPDLWNLLSSDRPGSLARNARTDLAICGGHAEEPAESVTGAAPEAAQSTTVAVQRLKRSELIQAQTCHRRQHRARR